MNYPKKPKKITGPRSLLKFIQGIPPSRFCVDTRDNYRGQYCVLGHLDNAYGFGNGRDGFTERKLAGVNNGTRDRMGYDYFAGWGNREARDGKSIKARLVKFLKENL